MLIRHCVTSTGVERSLVYLDVAISIKLEGGIPSEFDTEVSKKLAEAGDNPAQLGDMARRLFSAVNPVTGTVDVTGREVYAPMILDGVHTGIINVQNTDDGVPVFNGDGTFSLADLLVSLGVLYGGVKKRSLDNISVVEDYFNKGYNVCCWGISSPFFNLYRRDEVMRPIVRIEMAYIMVMCAKVFGSVNERLDGVGIGFNWLAPKEALDNYIDGCKYNVSLISDKDGVAKFDIRDYKTTRTMGEFLSDIKSGRSAIPLSMYMALVELAEKGAFVGELKPMRQVSRGEVLYLFNLLEGGDFNGNVREAVSVS